MPAVIIFLVLVIVLVVGGKFVFPLIGVAILALYHGVVAVIFNLLTIIYAVIPGHDFGIALIIFTILVRLLMWPLVKKQLHQTKVMRKLQPELKKIKQQTKGNKQLESQLMMELYREKGVNPFSSIGTLALQLPIILALYRVVHLITQDPHNVVTHSFGFVQRLGYMKEVTADLSKFNEKLFGTIDLTTFAMPHGGGLYIPLIIMAALAAIFQYLQSRQLLPQASEKKSLRQIFKEAGSGNKADQGDVTAAMSSSMGYILPIFTFIFAISVQGALTLYLLTTGFVGWAQQSYILGRDETELEAIADKKSSKKTTSPKTTERLKNAQEATVVEKNAAPTRKKRPVKKKGR
jgi:YidC/Oxa1 family membrane protein insertase